MVACVLRETQNAPLQAQLAKLIQQQTQTLRETFCEKFKEQDNKINTLVEDNKKLQRRIAELDRVKELEEATRVMSWIRRQTNSLAEQ